MLTCTSLVYDASSTLSIRVGMVDMISTGFALKVYVIDLEHVKHDMILSLN